MAEASPVTPRVDGFEILEPIGSGGFSRVYRARQSGFGREVALKVLDVGLDTPARQAAFERECRAMGTLSQHPNIVTVFTAAYSDDHKPCIAMEYYPGGTLADRMADAGCLPIGEVLKAGVELAGALQAAHDAGVMHRDIKPHNCFVSSFGIAALGDFGISSFADERTLTGAGALTVGFAPPELIEGDGATTASDLYSLAATLYALAAGAHPFPRTAGQSTADLARRILVEPAPLLAAAHTPPALAELLRDTMAKDPDDRCPSAAEFGALLQQIQADRGDAVTSLVCSGAPTAPSASRPRTRLPKGPPGAHDAPTVTATVLPLGPARIDQTDPDQTDPERVPAEAVPADSVPADSVPAVSPWQGPGNRRLTSAALGGFAILALVSTTIALAATDRSDPADLERPTSSTTAPGAAERVDDDAYFAAPTTPADVELRRTDTGVVATWQPSTSPGGGAVTYELRRVDTGNPDESVTTVTTTDTTSATIATAPDETVCVVVRAVGEGGHLSFETAPVCLGP